MYLILGPVNFATRLPSKEPLESPCFSQVPLAISFFWLKAVKIQSLNGQGSRCTLPETSSVSPSAVPVMRPSAQSISPPKIIGPRTSVSFCDISASQVPEAGPKA